MTTPALLITILGMAVVTYACRATFMLLLGKIEMPLWLSRALRFVPAAVLTALVLPAFLLKQGALNLTWHNERFIAGLIAVAVAWATKNVLLTIGAGMVVLWILQAIS